MSKPTVQPVMVDPDRIAAILAGVRQKMYSEMIYGNGRQPAECVEYVGRELSDYLVTVAPQFDASDFFKKSEPDLRDE